MSLLSFHSDSFRFALFYWHFRLRRESLFMCVLIFETIRMSPHTTRQKKDRSPQHFYSKSPPLLLFTIAMINTPTNNTSQASFSPSQNELWTFLFHSRSACCWKMKATQQLVVFHLCLLSFLNRKYVFKNEISLNQHSFYPWHHKIKEHIVQILLFFRQTGPKRVVTRWKSVNLWQTVKKSLLGTHLVD